MSRLKQLVFLTLIIVGAVNACTRLSRVVKPWSGGFQGEFSIPVSQSISTWSARIQFEHSVKKLEIWTAQATKENDKTFVLKPVSWNGRLGSGQTLKIEFVVHYSNGGLRATNPCLNFFPGQSSPGSSNNNNNNNPQPSKPSNNNNNNKVPGDGKGKKATPGAKYNYDDVLYKALLFYEAQRSGRLPSDNKIPWRGNSELNDGKDVGRDLTGGWHDAGDHVKFGLPMASSATMLLYGLEFIKDGYDYAGQFGMGLRQVRWALEYFRKCFVDKDRFYAQVADGDADHGWWGRPEDNHQHRPTFKIGAGNPGGADIMGETAAAMAAGYVVFKNVDGGFANSLLSDAKALYNLGKRNPGVSTKIIPNLHKFYNSDAWEDEMAHAAAWLAYAVGSGSGEYQGYLNDAKRYFKGGVPWSLSWSEKRPAVSFLLYKLTKDGQYKSAIENFLKEWLPGGSIPRTPQGLVWRDKWGSNRYAANAAMLALIAAKNGIRTKEYYNFAASQINFMLGDGGRSYVVGFGNNYPKRAHHKAASCPNRPAPCGWNEFNSRGPNPQILNGALVGGPGELNGNFIDDRSKFEYTEVATDYNAGFTSALAGMKYFAVHPA